MSISIVKTSLGYVLTRKGWTTEADPMGKSVGLDTVELYHPKRDAWLIVWDVHPNILLKLEDMKYYATETDAALKALQLGL